MASQPLATVKVHWLDPEHGGRKTSPSGPIYAATGQFTDHENELFSVSVILRFLPEKTSQMQSSSWIATIPSIEAGRKQTSS